MAEPYPIMLNLQHKPVAVIGGGHVAARKIRALLKIGATVTVISPTLDPSLDPQTIIWRQKTYERADVTQMAIIIACTDQPAVNQQVKDEAAPFQWVNNASNKADSDFFNVATVETEQVTVTVSTRGRSPMLAKQVRQELTEWLQQRHWTE